MKRLAINFIAVLIIGLGGLSLSQSSTAATPTASVMDTCGSIFVRCECEGTCESGIFSCECHPEDDTEQQ